MAVVQERRVSVSEEGEGPYLVIVYDGFEDRYFVRRFRELRRALEDYHEELLTRLGVADDDEPELERVDFQAIADELGERAWFLDMVMGIRVRYEHVCVEVVLAIERI